MRRHLTPPPSRAAGGLRQALGRLCAVLRQEGVTGLYDRLRYPKPLWRRQHPPAQVMDPVLIRGGDEAARDQIARALRDAGLVLAPAFGGEASPAGSVIHVDPAPGDRAGITQNDILVLLAPAFLPRGELLSLARRCQAILSPCPDILSALQQGGIPLEKIFALKGRHALHEGITRYLIAARATPADRQDWRVFSDLHDVPLRRLCLSLPETAARRQNFLAARPREFRIFDGIRAFPGWIGAASSFRLMARACLDQNIVPVLLCEDDVELPPDFEERFQAVQAYLAGCEWDLFSGLLTDIGPGYRVTKVTRCNDQTFVHLNRCVGMVCGLYNRAALESLASWTEETGMTIDRYLEHMQGLEVVTTLPFLAGHCDRLTSSVWHFDNQRYRNMIRNSEARLAQLVQEHEAGLRP